MNDRAVNSVHWSFWVISTVALIWNIGTAVNYIVQMNADSLSAYRAVEQAIIAGRPPWATTGFAIAAFGGALGSLLLLLRKPAAYYAFIASLLGVIVTSIHTVNVSSTIKFSPGEIVEIFAIPLLVSGFLIWYSRHAKSRGWIS
jgi:hypothetical protein